MTGPDKEEANMQTSDSGLTPRASNTEAADADYSGLDAWPALDILAAITDSNRRAVEAVARVLPDLEKAAAGIEERLRRGGRLVYVGAGTSGRLGLQDAAELAPTFGFDRAITLLAGGSSAQSKAQEGAEDDGLAAAREVDALEMSDNDAMIGVAASGGTPYTIGALKRARELGAFTVGIANNPGTPLLEVAHVGVLLETGPEVLAGSTRLAAGTAQKVALNALSTTVLVRLGGAYDNLMVGMRAVNAKLRSRAVMIVSQGARVSGAAASSALEAAGGDIRTAIVSCRTGVSAEQAREALGEHSDNVREALLSLGVE